MPESCLELIRSDLYRYHGKTDLAAFVETDRRHYGFRCTLFQRLCSCYRTRRGVFSRALLSVFRVIYSYHRVKFGDRVWIGAHAVVVGSISVGINALIGPGAYVNFDVPDNAVVIGNSGQVVSSNGTEGYIENLVPVTEDSQVASAR